MQKTQFVSDISPTDSVASVFVVTSANQGNARNGPFWKLEMADRTGTIGAKIWSPLSQQFLKLPTGTMIAVRGVAETYRDQLDVRIDQMKVLTEEEQAALDLGEFVPAAARPAQEMLDDLLALCRKTFTHEPWWTFVAAALDDEEIKNRFMLAVGAKNVHHAYVGGLLEHTLSVCELCMRLCDHYPELDRQVLLAGAVFHDMGKAWELSGGLANDYTDVGRLVGHIHIGLEKAEPFIASSGLDEELIMHFKHLVLGHHGTREWGSPVLPATPEALVLHYADNIDAKLAQLRSLFTDFEPEETGWTPFQRTLERFIYKPPRTPQSLALDDTVDSVYAEAGVYAESEEGIESNANINDTRSGSENTAVHADTDEDSGAVGGQENKETDGTKESRKDTPKDEQCSLL